MGSPQNTGVFEIYSDRRRVSLYASSLLLLHQNPRQEMFPNSALTHGCVAA